MLAASLAAYMVLYAGDLLHGVFAAFGPPQVTALTSIVTMAAGPLWLARRMARAGLLA